MKILISTFSYFPQTSGVPIVVQYIAEGLLKLGHVVAVVTRKNGFDLLDNEVVNGVNVYRFDIGQDLYKRNKGDIKKYIDFVVSFPKDVLIMECIQCQTTDLLLPYLKEMNCRVVLHSHGGPGLFQKPISWNINFLHSIGNTHNWYRWKKYYGDTLPRYAQYIDAVVCLSLCASDLDYMTSKMKRVEIVENAAHDMFFDESLYNLNVEDVLQISNKRYVLCIANYVPNKGQLAIIDAYSRIDAKDCSLVLIGSKKNAYYEKLKICSDKINSTQRGKEVQLLTGVDRSFFPSIIRGAELFIMASEHEEYPVSLVEAMAVGTPFISTDAGCARILPGGVTVTDRCDIRMVLQMLVNHPEMLEKYGRQGKSYALENNKTEKIVVKFETILKSIVKE